MRSSPAHFVMKTPATLLEALTLIQPNAEGASPWKPFAGGTDLMVLFEAGQLSHYFYLNLWNLKEPKGVSVEQDWITLGALSTYAELRESPELQSYFPNVCHAARE